jgi:hypothetical protein
MSETTRKPKKSKVDPNESKEQKFIRLAQDRGSKLLHQMGLLRNLGKSYAYKIDPDLAEELLEQFEEALGSVKDQWAIAINKQRSSTEVEETPEPVSSSAE